MRERNVDLPAITSPSAWSKRDPVALVLTPDRDMTYGGWSQVSGQERTGTFCWLFPDEPNQTSQLLGLGGGARRGEQRGPEGQLCSMVYSPLLVATQ